MSTEFRHIKEVRAFYPKPFLVKNVFSVIHLGENIGKYEIVHISNDTCEISLEIEEKHRNVPKKSVAIKSFNFPKQCGYNRTLIWTDLEKMHKFLTKMESYGVKYLKKSNFRYWFEVNYGK